MSLTIAYAGQPGAFAEEACRTFRPDHEPVPYPGFGDVAVAVADGRAACGMIPLKNSIAGPVPGVAALIADAALTVEDQRDLPVRMHLLGFADTDVDTLEVISSHPVALAQCAGSLTQFQVRQEEADNTAAAARRLAESGDRKVAVLASEHAASLYGLTILRHDLQDRADNVTTFGAIRRDKPPA